MPTQGSNLLVPSRLTQNTRYNPDAGHAWESYPATWKGDPTKICPNCGAETSDDVATCPACGQAIPAASSPAACVSPAESITGDSSKGLGLLFGILLILTVFGVAVSIRMLWTGMRASAIELILFGLLAAEALALLFAVHGTNQENPGLLRYMGVWILGLIPYFGWVVVYGAGKGLAEVAARRWANAPAIAALVFIAVIVLCLCVYLTVSNPPGPTPAT